MNLTGRTTSPKPARAVKDPARLAAVAELPCVICGMTGQTQNSRTQVHHLIHDRFGTRRSPDSETIPLCEGHHQGLMDRTTVALHDDPATWKYQYGKDYDYLPMVNKLLKENE